MTMSLSVRLARAASRVPPLAAAAQVPPATREVAVNRKLVLRPRQSIIDTVRAATEP